MRYYYGLPQGSGTMMHDFGIVPGIIGSLFMLALLTLTIIIIIKVIKHKHLDFTCNTHSNSCIDSAVAILNERYAKGEISDEEYQKKKAEISKP